MVSLVVWAGVCLVVVESDGFVVAESDAKAKNGENQICIKNSNF